MFDISFTELMLIGVIALVVIGPERLPKVARTVGHLLGRAQRYVGDVKKDIKREMDVEKFDDLKSQVQDAAKSVRSSIKDATDTIKNPLEQARNTVEEASSSMEDFAKTAHKEITSTTNPDPKKEEPKTEPSKPIESTALKVKEIQPQEPITATLSDTDLADARLKAMQVAKNNITEASE